MWCDFWLSMADALKLPYIDQPKDRQRSAPVGKSYRYSSSLRTPRGSECGRVRRVYQASGDCSTCTAIRAHGPYPRLRACQRSLKEPHYSTTAREERLAGLKPFSHLAGQAFRRSKRMQRPQLSRQHISSPLTVVTAWKSNFSTPRDCVCSMA